MPPGAAEMAALEAPWGHTPTEGTELIVGLRASPGGERQLRGRGVRPGHGSHRWGRVRPRVPGTRSAPAGATRRPGGSCGTVTPGRSPQGRPAPPFVPGSPSSLQPCAPACPRAGVSCPRAPRPPRARLHGPCGRGHRPGAGQRMSSTAPARHAHAPPRLVGVSAWPVALALPALPLLTVPSAASALSFDVPQLPGSVFSFAVPWGCFRDLPPAQTPPPSSRLVHLALSWTVPTRLPRSCSAHPTPQSPPLPGGWAVTMGWPTGAGTCAVCTRAAPLGSGEPAGQVGSAARRPGWTCPPGPRLLATPGPEPRSSADGPWWGRDPASPCPALHLVGLSWPPG